MKKSLGILGGMGLYYLLGLTVEMPEESNTLLRSCNKSRIISSS